MRANVDGIRDFHTVTEAMATGGHAAADVLRDKLAAAMAKVGKETPVAADGMRKLNDELDPELAKKVASAYESIAAAVGLMSPEDVAVQFEAFAKVKQTLDEQKVGQPVIDAFNKKLAEQAETAENSGYKIEWLGEKIADMVAEAKAGVDAAIMNAPTIFTDKEFKFELGSTEASRQAEQFRADVAGVVAQVERTDQATKELTYSLQVNEAAWAQLRAEHKDGTPEARALLETIKQQKAELDPATAAAYNFAEGLKGIANAAMMGQVGLGGLLQGVGGMLAQLTKDGGLGKLFSKEGLFGKDGLFGNKMTGKEAAGAGIMAGLDTLGQVINDKSLSVGEKAGASIGAGIGAGLGGMLGGPAGAAIGGMLGKIGGKFIGGLFGKAEFKKVQKDIQRDLGFALSEGTAQAIVDTKKKLGTTLKDAELIHLSDIISEADIGKGNFGQFAQKAVQAVELAVSGAKGAEEAAASLNDTYGALISKAEELGETGSKAFFDMIMAAREAESGIGLPPAVKEFIDGRLALAVSGVGKLFENLGDQIPIGRLNDLSTIMGNVADAIIGQGGDIKELIPQIDILIDRHKKLGQEGSEAYKKLVKERNFLTKNEKTLESIKGLTDITKGLGESTFLDLDAFQALQREGVRAYDKLIAGGASEKRALTAIAPLLQEQINAAHARGEALSGQTAQLADQAAAIGLVELKGTSLTNTLQQGFNAVIAAIKGVPVESVNAFGQTAAAAQQAGTAIVTGIGAGADQAGAKILQFQSQAQQAMAGIQSSEQAVADGTGTAVDGMIARVQAMLATASGMSQQYLLGVLENLERIRGAAGGLGGALGGLPGSTKETRSLPKRHGGGPVQAGEAYIIGRPGAEELFAPDQPGRVIPIGPARERRGEGGRTQNHVITINGPDGAAMYRIAAKAVEDLTIERVDRGFRGGEVGVPINRIKRAS